MFKTVIFDLDGTLLDTLGDLTDASNHICAQNGWPTFTQEQVRHMVGNGNPKLVERFTPESARTPERLADSLRQFMDLRKANGVTKAINLATNVAALAVYLFSGKVLLTLGLTAGLFSIAGNYIGARFFSSKGSKSVKPVILIVLGIFFIRELTEILG